MVIENMRSNFGCATAGTQVAVAHTQQGAGMEDSKVQQKAVGRRKEPTTDAQIAREERSDAKWRAKCLACDRATP